MPMKDYVGITGAVTVQETKDICKEFSNAGYGLETPHIPMLGFLVSYKTLKGQQTKNRRYPQFNEIPELLRATENKFFTMIHYNSRVVESLSDQVAEIFDGIYQEDLCRAIQLNVIWPYSHQVKKIKEEHPDMNIVFQLSYSSMQGKTPTQIAEIIKTYDDVLSYVLIDPSGGRGIPFDIESSVSIYSELRNRCPDVHIGFAGGFNGDDADLRIDKLIRYIGNDQFSIDAEGGLRDKITSEYGDDILNIEKVRRYLELASTVLR